MHEYQEWGLEWVLEALEEIGIDLPVETPRGGSWEDWNLSLQAIILGKQLSNWEGWRVTNELLLFAPCPPTAYWTYWAFLNKPKIHPSQVPGWLMSNIAETH